MPVAHFESGLAWSPRANLKTARFWHTAAQLPSGKVLVVGGNDAERLQSNSTELYGDPPDAPHVTTPVSGQRFFNTARPGIAGWAESGSTVTLTLDEEEITQLPVDVYGSWSYAPPTPLEIGSHTLTVSGIWLVVLGGLRRRGERSPA